MPFVSMPDIRLYYEIEGKGQPLVLIAGYTCDLTIWDPIREALARHFQLILFDNRGVGRTESQETSMTVEQMTNDTLHLIKHLQLFRPHILGHSLGAAIAQSMALLFPQEIGKTIFATPFLKIHPITAAFMQTVIHLREDGVSTRRQLEVIMPWIFSNRFMSNAKQCENFLQTEENPPYPLSLDHQKKQLEALLSFDSRKWYHRITTPTLVLCGDEDLVCPPQEALLLANTIPHAKLHVFQNMGHMAPIEESKECCDAVKHFLNS